MLLNHSAAHFKVFTLALLICMCTYSHTHAQNIQRLVQSSDYQLYLAMAYPEVDFTAKPRVDNITEDFKELGFDGMDWTPSACIAYDIKYGNLSVDSILQVLALEYPLKSSNTAGKRFYIFERKQPLNDWESPFIVPLNNATGDTEIFKDRLFNYSLYFKQNFNIHALTLCSLDPGMTSDMQSLPDIKNSLRHFAQQNQ